MRTVISVAIIFIAVFYFFPNLDLWVSNLFYDPEHRFPLRKHGFSVFIYYLVRVLAYTIVIGLFLALTLNYFKKFNKFLPSNRHIIFLLLALIIGPGLVVHQGFKEAWERARPVNITEFGGVKTYSPPLQISDQGGKSFVSGHAAMGFYMAAFAFLATGRRRQKLYEAGIWFGAFTGGTRIVQGAHFLSDVLFSAVVTLFVIHLLYWLLFERVASKK